VPVCHAMPVCHAVPVCHAMPVCHAVPVCHAMPVCHESRGASVSRGVPRGASVSRGAPRGAGVSRGVSRGAGVSRAGRDARRGGTLQPDSRSAGGPDSATDSESETLAARKSHSDKVVLLRSTRCVTRHTVEAHLNLTPGRCIDANPSPRFPIVPRWPEVSCYYDLAGQAATILLVPSFSESIVPRRAERGRLLL
jgi:hypothetical protein